MNNLYSLGIISGWIVIILISSTLTKRFLPNKAELSRKIVHIGTGPIIIMAWFFELPRLICIVTAALITFGLSVNYRLRLFNSIEDIQRKSFGTIAYGISITLLIILFWPSNADAVCFGILGMAFGDGFAGLLGKGIKSPNWLVLGQKKSLLGTLTMGAIVALLITSLSSVQNIPIDPVNIVFLTSLGILLEQISPLGIDNLTVPIGLACAWKWLV